VVIKEKRTIIFLSVVIAVFIFSSYFRWAPEKHLEKVYSLPLAFDRWKGFDLSYDHALLTSWLGTDNIVFRRYQDLSKGQVVTIYIAYYPNIESSDKAHAPEVCYPGQGWEVKSNKNIDVMIYGSTVKIKRMCIERNAEHQVVYSWWQTSSNIIAGNTWYHLEQIFKRLRLLDTSSIWVRISSESVPVSYNKYSGEAAVKAFSKDVAPYLSNYFQQKS